MLSCLVTILGLSQDQSCYNNYVVIALRLLWDFTGYIVVVVVLHFDYFAVFIVFSCTIDVAL